MNGTVAPPSSSSTAAATCWARTPSSLAICWAICCAIFCAIGCSAVVVAGLVMRTPAREEEAEMASRAHRGPHMDAGGAILQSLPATQEMLITAPWQYEDVAVRLVRPAFLSAPGSRVLEIAPKGIHRNGISRLDRRRHGAGG